MNHNENKLKVGILGYGKIAHTTSPHFPNYSLSHLTAILKNQKLQVNAIFEPHPVDILKEHAHYFFTSNENEFWSKQNDLVVIASPTAFHLKQLKKAIESHTPYILLEKPFGHSKEEIDEFQKIIDHNYKTGTSKIILNLPRHFDLAHRSLYERIKKNEFGKPLTFSAHLTKGLIHNGIHMLDLISNCFGNDFDIFPLNIIKAEHDILGLVNFKSKEGEGTINCLPSGDYSLFELVIYFEQAKISIINNGRIIQILKATTSNLYQHFKELNQLDCIEETYQDAIDQVYLNLLSLDHFTLYSKLNHWLELNCKLINIKDNYDNK